MGIFFSIMMAAFSVFLIWRTAQALRQNPELLSKINVSNSLKTFGQLALGLIAFVSVLVLLLRL